MWWYTANMLAVLNQRAIITSIIFLKSWKDWRKMRNFITKSFDYTDINAGSLSLWIRILYLLILYFSYGCWWSSIKWLWKILIPADYSSDFSPLYFKLHLEFTDWVTPNPQWTYEYYSILIYVCLNTLIYFVTK